jgi:hypothetical protein
MSSNDLLIVFSDLESYVEGTRICLKKLRKTKKNLSYDSPCSGQDSMEAPPEHKSEANQLCEGKENN